MATMKFLLSILGTDVYDLSEKELNLASRIVDWFRGDSSAESPLLKSDKKLIEACKYALRKEGMSWDSVMLNRTRGKKIVDYRDVVILIVWRRISGTQSYKSMLLGGMLDRSTLVHSVRNASDWLKYDVSYKALYGRMTKYVDEYLKGQ